MRPAVDRLNTPFAMHRRDFLWMTALGAVGLTLGCATDPITGKSQLMLVSEQEELAIDKRYAPYQVSTDYGTVQDQTLVTYLQNTGQKIARQTHRPQLPYAFKPVNAVYINAYAFPGGTIATTRGILLKLNNEAELGALLGHELGHVNARHTAEQMSKGKIASLLVTGLGAAVQSSGSQLGQLASSLGMMGAGALLASYSREAEREADALGMEYMVRAGYSPEGMVGLMKMLNGLSKRRASAAELLFATHPMSTERYSTAVNRARSAYPSAKTQPLFRQRYMDHTSGLRAIAPAIESIQEGTQSISDQKYDQAKTQFRQALKIAPTDYTALIMMAKCQVMLKNYKAARRFGKKAQALYPNEAQSYFVTGYAHIRLKQYDAALNAFNTYEKRLPGVPTTIFFKGLAYEGQENRKAAANAYYQYLQSDTKSDRAQYAYRRLVEWGYIKPQQ